MVRHIEDRSSARHGTVPDGAESPSKGTFIAGLVPGIILGETLMRGHDQKLQDRFGRTIDYLRVSVTDRCDLRCTYCIPEGFMGFEPAQNWLTFDEIERVAGAFAALGVSRIRLTGGEPLLRRGLPELASRLSALRGVEDLALSTNATQLERHAHGLKQAGVSRLNVSLDSLRPERVRRITGHDALGTILAGLTAGKTAGFSPIKINMVVMGGVNDDEIDDMVRFCMEHGFILRLIEAMPMGETGRSVGYVDLQPVKQRLRERFGLVDGLLAGSGPARYLCSPHNQFTVGFITPMSQHFCGTCNRVRLSVDGTLYMCLSQDERFELRPLLRSGASDADLADAIRAAIELKPARHEFLEKPSRIVRVMAKTGG
jgi:cyclic pyranopterin phosphate synthase